jgi:hypothetical protein
MCCLGLLVAVAILLVAGWVAAIFLYVEPARSIPNEEELYIFDPFTLQTQALTREVLTPVPERIETELITGTKGIVTNEDVLYRLADTFVRRDETIAFRLRQVDFDRTPCAKSLEGFAEAYIAYLAEGVDRWPGSPFEFASVTISMERGFLSFRSSYLQPHDPLVQGPLLSAYPPPVPYRRAMQIALANGGEEAMQRLGPTCQLGVTLRADVWTIAWFPQDIYRSTPLLVQEIDANSGEVRRNEWEEEAK